MKKLLLLLFISFGLIGSSYAELDSEAYALRKLAKNHAYGEGGYLQDPREAIILFKKYLKRVGEPTEENDARNVMNTIANFYLDYLNNSNEALIWYNKSAELGHFWSQYTLGEIYREGNGVPKSLERAADWYKIAFENNSVIGKQERHRVEYIWNKYKLWNY